jgi:hypothetical protein
MPSSVTRVPRSYRQPGGRVQASRQLPSCVSESEPARRGSENLRADIEGYVIGNLRFGFVPQNNVPSNDTREGAPPHRPLWTFPD